MANYIKRIKLTNLKAGILTFQLSSDVLFKFQIDSTWSQGSSLKYNREWISATIRVFRFFKIFLVTWRANRTDENEKPHKQGTKSSLQLTKKTVAENWHLIRSLDNLKSSGIFLELFPFVLRDSFCLCSQYPSYHCWFCGRKYSGTKGNVVENLLSKMLYLVELRT